MSERIGWLLVENGVIKFNVESPFRYTSGIVSPVYTNCRAIMSLVDVRREVLAGLQSMIKGSVGGFDGFSGTADAGIPWAAFMADRFDKKMVFVRKKPHPHGLGKQIEGLYAEGERFVGVEDHVTTGGSLLRQVDVLRAEGLVVEDCVSITTYNLAEAREGLEKKGVRLHSLTDIEAALRACSAKGVLKKTDADAIADWLRDPRGWAGRRGVKADDGR